MTISLRTVLAACSILLACTTTEAREATIGLTMAGEAFDGPPKFRLLADGRQVGAGDVTNAIDTQNGAKLKIAKDVAPPASNSFTFKIADIDSISQLDVEFTNDDWAGAGKPGDRNLYLLSLSVSTSRTVPDGSITTIHEFSPTAFEAVMAKPGGNKITSLYGVLNNKGSLRLKRPKQGWGPGATAAVVAKAKGASTPGCKIASIDIGGFEKNAASLPPKMLDRLAQASKSLAGKSCMIQITAYTGGGKSEAFRKGLSQARAQTVATELAKLGVPKENINIGSGKGGGRRVTISFQ